MLTLDRVKLKSMPRMSGLHPVLVAGTVALIERCYARGVNIIITRVCEPLRSRRLSTHKGAPSPGRSSPMRKAEPVTTITDWLWTSPCC